MKKITIVLNILAAKAKIKVPHYYEEQSISVLLKVVCVYVCVLYVFFFNLLTTKFANY